MCDLAPTEHNRDFDLVAVAQQARGGTTLGFHVVPADVGSHLDLVQAGGFLATPTFALALGLLVLEASVVHHAGDWRTCARRNLNQIEPLALGKVEGLRRGHNAQLLPFRTDHPHFADADLVVDSLFSVFSMISGSQNEAPSLVQRCLSLRCCGDTRRLRTAFQRPRPDQPRNSPNQSFGAGVDHQHRRALLDGIARLDRDCRDDTVGW